MKKSILFLAILFLPFIEMPSIDVLAFKEQIEPIVTGEWVADDFPIEWQPISSFNESDLLAPFWSWTKDNLSYLTQGFFYQRIKLNLLIKIEPIWFLMKEKIQDLKESWNQFFLSFQKIKSNLTKIEPPILSSSKEDGRSVKKSTLLAKAEQTWVSMKEGIQTLKKVGKRSVYISEKGIANFLTKVEHIWSFVKEGAQSFVKESWEQLVDTFQRIKSWTSISIKEGMQTLSDAGHDLFHFFQKGAQTLSAKIEHTLSSAKENITSFAKESWKQTLYFSQKGTTNLLAKTESIRSSLKESYKHLINFSQKVKSNLSAKIGYGWPIVKDSVLGFATGEWVPDIAIPYLEKEAKPIVQKVEIPLPQLEVSIEAPIASIPIEEEPPRQLPQESPPPSFLPLNPVVFDSPCSTYRSAPCEEPVLQFLPFIFESDVH
ncbi:MAG TPA: hypothetical protein VLE89_03110 [Chlamydiales bacterium]|nr:hypothetical protein [Chlamydiales bacterium]